jgi:hypothetical protein
MSEIDYAHPTTEDQWNDGQRCGITMRDYFAAAALTGIVSNLHCTPSVTFDEVAARAYQQADAMLKARKEGA